LGIARLAEANLGIDRQRVIEVGGRLAGNPDADEAARISAIQACSRLQGTSALPLVVQIARAAETIPLRISAIGALGGLGGKNELTLLSQIANESNRLKPVAETAIQRINQRNSGPL
jgi:hypothetical protein